MITEQAPENGSQKNKHMKQYYFFKIATVQNQSGQMRKTVFPLPGQHQCSAVYDGDEIDATLKVQLALAENTKACAMPDDTIIGVEYESVRNRELMLSKYSREQDINGERVRVYFYRTDKPIFLVSVVAYDIAERVHLQRADEEMLAAFRALTSENFDWDAFENEGVPEVHDEQPSATVSQAPSSADELRAIEERFAMNGSPEDERRNLKKLLKIAQVLDRMKIGVAQFSYFKQNGNYREAYGTRNHEIIRLLGGNTENPRADRNGNYDGEHVAYFDIQRRDWRCFCAVDIDEVGMNMIPQSQVNDVASAPVTDE